MPSTSTVRGVVASHSINKLLPHERGVTWKLWWRIDDFHIAKTGATIIGLAAFIALHIVYGLFFAEVTEQGVAILSLWFLCVSLAVAVALWLGLRTWYYDPLVERKLAALRRDIYAQPEKQNAFRYLCRTVRDLMPKDVLRTCE